jgi:hypothetical protein
MPAAAIRREKRARSHGESVGMPSVLTTAGLIWMVYDCVTLQS